MRIKISLLFLLVLFGAGLFFNFQKTPAKVTVQQLIDESIEQKIQRYSDIRNKRCSENLLDEAGRLADSIIIAQAKALKVLKDTVTRPVAPLRPDRPELLPPIDSSFPTPILNAKEDTTLVDQ